MYMKCIDRGKLLIDILQTFLSVYMLHHKYIQWKVQIVFQQSASIRRLQYFLEKHAKLFFAPAVFCVFCVTIAKNGFSSIYIYILLPQNLLFQQIAIDVLVLPCTHFDFRDICYLEVSYIKARARRQLLMYIYQLGYLWSFCVIIIIIFIYTGYLFQLIKTVINRGPVYIITNSISKAKQY